MLLEAKLQAELLYSFRAINKFMTYRWWRPMCVVVPACGHNICCRAVTISTVAVAAAVFQLFVCLRINTSVSCRLFVNYRCNNSPAVVITHTKIASFRFVRKELLGLNSPGFCDAQGGAIKVVRFVFVHLFNVVFQCCALCAKNCFLSFWKSSFETTAIWVFFYFCGLYSPAKVECTFVALHNSFDINTFKSLYCSANVFCIFIRSYLHIMFMRCTRHPVAIVIHNTHTHTKILLS